MQGASRAALDEAWGEVERQLSSSGKSSHAEATKVADELFGTLAVLDAQVGLRRALSDPAVEADRKTALVEGSVRAADQLGGAWHRRQPGEVTVVQRA